MFEPWIEVAETSCTYTSTWTSARGCLSSPDRSRRAPPRPET